MAYYSHNLHFLADSHMMQGRFADARQAAQDLSAWLTPHVSMMPMGESMIVTPISVLLRFGRFDDILALPEPPVDQPVVVAWWRFARTVALAKKGQIDQAVAEQAAFAAATKRVPETALFGGTGLEPASTVLAIARLVADARIAEARKTADQAIALWRKAVAAADKLAYDEPPVWFYPLRESLGAALVSAGRAVEAEAVFREDLMRHPRNARSLFGLRHSLVIQKKVENAEAVAREFDRAWKAADTTLTIDDF
jgi:hypothetical protein